MRFQIDRSERVAEDVDRRYAALTAIKPPVTEEEATLLLNSFGRDECFGLAWALLHLIESAPAAASSVAKPDATANEWIRRLWDRAHRDT
jgi:hypothetical protein